MTVLPKIAASSAATTTETENNMSEQFKETVGQQMDETASLFRKLIEPFFSAWPSILTAVIVAIIGYILIRILMRFINHGLKRSNMDGIAVNFLRSVFRIILYVLLAVILLSMLHVPMDSIIAVIVSSSMAIALALKDSLSHVAGGFILLFAKPIKEGDIIEVEGAKGKVESVGILYTKLVTRDNTTIYIPNGKVSAAKIINYTDKAERRVDLHFTISYQSSIDDARNVILSAVKNYPEILNSPEPVVRVESHGDNAVGLLLCVWVNGDDNYWKVYYCLMEQVKKDFDAAGIEIPFPQVDIHSR